jgi:thermitase
MLRRRLHLGAIAAFCVLALPPLAAAAPSKAEREAAQTVLVRFAPSVSPERRAALLARAGVRPVRTIGKIGFVVGRVGPSKRAGALAYLRRSGATRVAESGHVFRALDTIPTDPGYTTTDPSYAPNPWSWEQLRLPRAWDFTTGSSSVTIAIIDTGVAPTQLDLAGRLVPGIDEVNNDPNPDDDHGHGTEVATTAAGGMNNGQSVGACPGCSIMPVKVLDSSGYGTDANIANGIIWATDNGADIINLSLGGSYNDGALAAAIAYAISNNVLVVSAAGNSASSQPSYPGAYSGVISVGASDVRRNLLSFSQFGPWVDVAAPGCVNAGDRTNAVAVNVCGTSFASPLVAGIAGLLLSANPGMTAAQLKSAIETKAMTTGADVRNGIVDAANLFGAPAAPAYFVPGFLLGAAQSGQTLTAVVPQWLGSAPLTTTHRWYRCDSAGANCVAQATGTTYTLTDSDIGSKIKFEDTATNPAGSFVQTAPLSEVVVSAFAPAPPIMLPPASVPGQPPLLPGSGAGAPTTLPTTIVVAPSLPPQPPSIVGTPVVGGRLSANPGAADNGLNTRLGYTWQVLRGSTWRAQPGATDQDFDVPKSFGGLKVRVVVTTRDSSGAVQKTSTSSAVTIKAPQAAKNLKLRLKLKR